MIEFLVFGGIFVLFVGLTGLTIFLGVWQSREQRAGLVAIAPQLGLVHDEGRRLVGTRDGVPVEVSHSASGGGRSQTRWTNVAARIEPPLRLGIELRARSSGVPGNLKDLLGEDLVVGDAELDGRYRIGAVEVDAVTQLVRDPELRGVLLATTETFDRIVLTDERAFVSVRGYVYDPAYLGRALDWVVALTRAVRAARRRLGRTARDAEVAQKWGSLAAERGFHLDEESLVLQSIVGDVRFTVAPVVEPEGWATRFRAELRHPLGVDLRLSKQDGFDQVASYLGMQDIEVGDPAFDDAFVVKGLDPDAVRHVLGDPDVRAGLLRILESAKRLSVEDRQIDAVAHGLISDPALLTASLEQVVSVARGLAARRVLRGVGRRGALR